MWQKSAKVSWHTSLHIAVSSFTLATYDWGLSMPKPYPAPKCDNLHVFRRISVQAARGEALNVQDVQIKLAQMFAQFVGPGRQNRVNGAIEAAQPGMRQTRSRRGPRQMGTHRGSAGSSARRLVKPAWCQRGAKLGSTITIPEDRYEGPLSRISSWPRASAFAPTNK